MSAKRINITLPEELLKVCEDYCSTHYSALSEMIKNALIAYIPGDVIEPPEKPMDEVPDKLTSPCEMPYCKQNSQARYKITTDGGDVEKLMNLCVYHWNKARKEGEVSEVE